MRYYVKEEDTTESPEFKVTGRYRYNEGEVWEYRNGGFKKDYVFLPPKYKPFVQGRKVVAVKLPGNSSGARLVSADADCPGEDLSCLVRTHLLAIGYRSLYEKNVPMKWLIIGGIGLAVVVAVAYFMRGGAGPGG